MTTGQLRLLIEGTFKKWNEDNAARMAAAFAFYATLSLAPLLVFAVAIGSHFINSGELRDTLVREAQSRLGPGSATLVLAMVENSRKAGLSAAPEIISLLLSLLGASGLFEQLDLSINNIWKAQPLQKNAVENFLLMKLLSIVMAFVFVTLLVAWVAITSALKMMGKEAHSQFSLVQIGSFVASFLFLTVVFAIIFKSLPRKMVAWQDVWLPAAITALGFGLSEYVLGLYFGMSSVATAYGPAGALVVVLLWLYYASQIFFFGAELTYVYSSRHGSHSHDSQQV